MDKKFEEFQGIFLFQINSLQQTSETQSARNDKLITGMEKKLEEFQENFQNQVNLIQKQTLEIQNLKKCLIEII